MTNYQFSIVIEKDKDGYYASCDQLKNCHTQGETYEEALENIKDATSLHVKDRIAVGEKIQSSQYVSLFLMVRLYERLTPEDKRHRGDYLDYKKIRMYVSVTGEKP